MSDENKEETSASENLGQWRGRMDERLKNVADAVLGENGLVARVQRMELRIERTRGGMAIFAAIGSFIGTIVSSVVIAVLVKAFLKN
jgi:hypothetical protein